jgi:drug/metabolite transporter (DMT)-like permease
MITRPPPLILATLCAITAVFFLFLMNVLAKTLADVMTPMETAFWRNALSTIILVPFVLWRFGPRPPPMGQPKTMVIRSVLGSVTLMLGMGAYFHLPLADANAIILSAPLILTLLAARFLNEQITRARLLWTIVGLAGVLAVATPSGQLSMLGTTLAIAAAFSYAVIRMLLRKLGKTEDPLAMSFYFLAIGSIFNALLMPFIGQVPPIATWGTLLAIGACGALGQYLNALSHKLADASFIGVFVYTQLLWAIPFDYFLWDHAPHATTLLGGAIIILSNIAMVVAEKRRRQTAP